MSSHRHLLTAAAILLSSSLLGAQQIGGQWDLIHDVHGHTTNEWLGQGLSNAGDLNGDGLEDYMIGAGSSSYFGFLAGGEVTIYSGADHSVLRVKHATGVGQYLGNSLAVLGDVDGDGITDLLFGSPGANNPNGRSATGAAYIVSGATGSYIHSLYGWGGGDSFGETVAAAGDVDGDGVMDAIVGAPYAGTRSSGGNRHHGGAAFVYSGATGDVIYSKSGLNDYRYVGHTVGTIGDVNGDGHSEFIVGSKNFPGVGNVDRGAVKIYDGASGAMLYQLRGEHKGDLFGISTCLAGDLDGDGIGDFLIGAPFADSTNEDSGTVYAFSGVNGAFITRVDGEFWHQTLGYSLSYAGDTNGDGFDEFLAGSILGKVNGVPNAGSASLFSLNNFERLHRFDGQVNAGNFGVRVAGVGDTNGDGLSDLLISAWGEYLHTGAAYLYSFAPFLKTSSNSLSASAGGTLQLELDFPNSIAGHGYSVLISAAGSGQAAFHQGLVPLTADRLFRHTASGGALMQMPDGFGILDASGNASVSFTLAPNSPSATIGQSFWFAATALSPFTGEMEQSSIAVQVRIAP